MTGDLHDAEFPDSEDLWYDHRTLDSGHLMQAALCWLGIYFFVIKPFGLLGSDSNIESMKSYDCTGLKPRQFLARLGVKTWRDYEHWQYVSFPLYYFIPQK